MNQTIYRLLLILLSTGSLFAQTTFGILPLEAIDVQPAQSDEALNSLYQNFIESGRYNVVTRKEIEKVLSEQALQQSGAVDSGKIAACGKLLGIEKLISGNIYLINKNYQMKVSVIDVATSQVEFSKDFPGNFGVSPATIAKWCVGAIINEYPLLGKVKGMADDKIIINLGKTNGIKSGDRLFVARKESLLGKEGEILMTELKRIGMLWVEKTNGPTSQAKVMFLQSKDNPIRQGDFVSPEPIPKKETIISYASPLIPEGIKDSLLLDDNMSKNSFLSIINNTGPSYAHGKLQLNATELPQGNVHAYCSYPLSIFGSLQNCVIEGEFQFQKIKALWNIFSIRFRSNGDYEFETGYTLVINQQGYFSIKRLQRGTCTIIVPYQNTQIFLLEGKTNNFKIVAVDSRFDIYLNGKFLVGFEDEYFYKGNVGFMVEKDGYVTVDNVKIWNVAKGRK
ncbi:MAG: CsgG/HfaB family protein [Chitinivibrionales bacterium]